jgi:orotidine-5'-phosphate decarboxylase
VGERPTQGFADRLATLVEERRSQIVLGLDPDPTALWPVAVEAGAVPPGGAAGAGVGAAAGAAPSDPREIAELTGAAVERHCRAAIEAAGPHCVGVKPQLACFERLGAPGWAALQRTVEAAHEHGLLLIADAKRGDVPVSAAAYAQGLVGETPGPYGPTPGLNADAFTANPLLGRDALEPFVEAARQASAGVFVLVRTSNPGAAEIQDEPPGQPLHEKLARIVDEMGRDSVGASGLSDIGAVTGATRPDLLKRLRDLMPSAIFLLPGVGAQGGSAADLGPAFRKHPAGGLIASSRSIVGAHMKTGGDPAKAAAHAAEELRKSAWRA